MRQDVQLLDCGQVTRYHTEPIPTRQNNAEHQWGVAVILMMITKPSYALLCAALTHDMAERKAGDMPAPFKWSNPEVRVMLDAFEHSISKEYGTDIWEAQLTVEEKKLLKLADYLEAATFSHRIFKQGVQYGLSIFNNLYRELTGQFNIRQNPGACSLLNQLIMSLRHDFPEGMWYDHHPLVLAESGAVAG